MSGVGDDGQDDASYALFVSTEEDLIVVSRPVRPPFHLFRSSAQIRRSTTLALAAIGIDEDKAFDREVLAFLN